MPNYICVTCGNQYLETGAPPAHCPICEDERQYVNPRGQTWTTLAELQQTSHNVIRPLEPSLLEIATEPKFGIGQRALLVQAAGGNVLWDCVSLVDDATIAALEALGGVSALASSHPHMFGSMVEWSHAFGQVPIYLHASYERWVQRPDLVIHYWEGDSYQLREGVSLHRCGGHFTGSTALLWAEGAGGRGVLLSSDTLHVTPDRRHVSFMRSYPNYIPLSAATVDAIVGRVLALPFDRIYSHFYHLEIESNAKEAINRSAQRYKEAIGISPEEG